MKQYDILIVDDEEGIREILADFTLINDFTSATAESGIAALEWLSRHPAPRVIICDISMPGMTGLEFVEKVKLLGLPSAIIMLTAHSESNKVIEALRLGALDYICKPFDSKMLMTNLAGWVEIGKRLSELQGDAPQQLRMIELFKLKNKARSDSAA